jgi:HEAT repeat protein
VGSEVDNKATIKDEKAISELLGALKSKDDTERYSSFKVLLRLSEEQPELLYPNWDFLVEMLDSDNAYQKLIAVRLVANLTRVDTENRFEKIFDKYYNLLNDSVIVAGHITADSGKIARAKPKLQAEITARLLNIDKTSQKHRGLIKAGAIESFGEYFEESKDKGKMIEFVKQQLDCESPKTRKKAREFLEKWGRVGK